MDVHNLPIAILLDQNTAFIVSLVADMPVVGDGEHEGVGGNGRITIQL
jgi:hypothetical protein